MKEVVKFRARGWCGARCRCNAYIAPERCGGRCFWAWSPLETEYVGGRHAPALLAVVKRCMKGLTLGTSALSLSTRLQYTPQFQSNHGCLVPDVSVAVSAEMDLVQCGLLECALWLGPIKEKDGNAVEN